LKVSLEAWNVAVHIVAVSAEKRLLVVERGLRRSIANLRGEQPL
jgi:hypothetical protein